MSIDPSFSPSNLLPGIAPFQKFSGIEPQAGLSDSSFERDHFRRGRVATLARGRVWKCEFHSCTGDVCEYDPRSRYVAFSDLNRSPEVLLAERSILQFQ